MALVRKKKRENKVVKNSPYKSIKICRNPKCLNKKTYRKVRPDKGVKNGPHKSTKVYRNGKYVKKHIKKTNHTKKKKN